ncbi:MAG: hypothetical protein AAB353_09090 [Candidatus Hydrogenedentota bacterium]
MKQHRSHFPLLGLVAVTALAAIPSSMAHPQEPAPPEANAETPNYIGWEFKADTFEGEYGETFRPTLLDGDARIVFLAEDPAENMTVTAKTMRFAYTTSDGGTPDEMELEGGVVIVRPDGEIHADTAKVRFAKTDDGTMGKPIAKLFGHVNVVTQIGPDRATITSNEADIDYEKGEAVFRGDFKLNSPQIQSAQGEEARLDLNAQKFVITKMSARMLSLTNTKDQTKSLHLTAADVRDVPGWLGALKSQAAAKGENPGKHILSVVSEAARVALINLPIATLEKDAGGILKEMNKALASEKFYDANSWNGIDLPQAAKDLLAAKERTPAELFRLNRLLLAVAYPIYVAPPNG